MSQAGVLGMLYISALPGDGLSELSLFGRGAGSGGGGAEGRIGEGAELADESAISRVALGVGIASRSPHLCSSLAGAAF